MICKYGQPDIEQGDIDMLPPARTLALGERGLNADGAVKTGEDIDPCNADLLRLAIGCAGQVHDAAHALDQEIITGLGGAGAGLAEAGDRTIDEARVEGGERWVIEPVTGKAAELEIFDEHVGAGDERFEAGELFGVVEIAN